MRISAKDLVNKFYEEVAREKYPHISKEHILMCCYIPFKYFRRALSSRMLPTIRFKYLGEFYASPKRAWHFINIILPRLENKPHPSALWKRMIENSSKYVINRELCKLEELRLNEKGLKTKAIDEVKYKKLIKLYTNKNESKD